jgi:thiamine-phosphate pyrophosphorylase
VTSSVRRFDLSLYLVVDPAWCEGRSVDEIVAEAVRGGVTLVQLRLKDGSTRAFIEAAERLHSVLRETGVPLVINDRVDVALAVGAEGVHLGQSDMPVPVARRLLGAERIIGLTTDTIEQVAAASELDVDYLGIGPVRATSTKSDTEQPWGCDGLRRARQASRHPFVGIGGVGLDNGGDVIRSGADGIAVVTAICAARDPCAAAQELAAAVTRARQ